MDTNDASDAWVDPDADSLINLLEQHTRTDPFARDTDRDGMSDLEDPFPVDRVFIDWGSPRFTSGDSYEYAAPDWWVASYRDGGEWLPEVPAWHASVGATDEAAALHIEFDRARIASDLIMEVECVASDDAVIAIELYDADGVPITRCQPTSLPAGRGTANGVIACVLPLALHADAIGVGFVCLAGEITVHMSAVSTQVGGRMVRDDTMDEHEAPNVPTVSSVSLGKRRLTGSSASRGASGGADVLGGSLFMQGGGGTTIYVDAAVGDDSYPGTSMTVTGGDGPKKTITNALAVTSSGDVISVAAGTYEGHAGKVSVPQGKNLMTRGRVIISAD